MKQKIVQFSLLSLLLLVAGFGCRGLSATEENAVRPITLTYWTVENDVGMLQSFAAQYKQIRPYVTVVVRSVREETFDEDFVTALADNNGPDIVSMHVHNMSEHRHRLDPMPSSVEVASIEERGTVRKETVVNIFRNTMPSRSFIESQYIKTVGEDIVSGGNIYGLPLAIDTLALYYNRDLLDKAGIPEPPVDWDTFLDAVAKTTVFNNAGAIVQPGVALGTTDNIENFFDIFSLLLMQNGVTLAQGRTVTLAGGIKDNPVNHPALQTLRFYTDFANPTRDVYTWDADMPDAFTSFVSGKSAFYFGFASERSRILSQAPQMDLEVIPVPQLRPDNPVNIADYWIESVVRESRNKDEAWDFIRFISTDDKILAYSNRTGQPSPLRSHVTQQSEDERFQPFSSQILRATNWYRGKEKGAAADALAQLVKSYVAPVPEDLKQEERDAAILSRAAQVIQQTY